MLPRTAAALRALLCSLPGYDPYADAGDCYFDREAAEKPLRFMARFIKGPDRKPLALQRWQIAFIANLFGWMRRDGSRRFREALLYVPRKNGKTTLVAAILLFVLLADRDPKPDVFSAASTRDQANVLLRSAKAFVHRDAALKKRLGKHLFANSILRPGTATQEEAAYQTLAAKEDGPHGRDPHMIVVDELHTQKGRDFVDALTTGKVARREPLTLFLTTADYDRPSFCNEKLKYARQVRDGLLTGKTARTFLPAIYAADLEDPYDDRKTWAKANPNLGVSINEDELAESCDKAAGSPGAIAAFKRLHLNVQTGVSSSWLKVDLWDQAPPMPSVDELKARPCWGGLDLALTTDLSAYVLVFPPRNPNETWACLPRFWAPREHARNRAKKDRVPYLDWAEQNLLTLTAGDVTDFAIVRQGINELRKEFPLLVDVGLDMHLAQEMATNLRDRDGFEVVRVAQNFTDMTSATRELERLVISKQIAHGDHPILRWMAGNVHLIGGRNGSDYVRPNKEKSTERIDGIVALIIGIARAMTRPVVPPRRSMYATEGVRSL